MTTTSGPARSAQSTIADRRYLRTLLTPVVAAGVFIWQPSGLGFWFAAALPFLLDLNAAFMGRETRPPTAEHARGWMEAILYVQFALHWLNLGLGLLWVARVGWWSIEAPVILLFLIQAGGLTGPIGGHEHLHHRHRHRQLFGRLLYCSILYEHWCIEHLLGHHVDYATRRDPSTARLDESFVRYLLRMVPEQAAKAWRLERERHAASPTWLAIGLNWIVQGLVVEALLVLMVFSLFGVDGLILFVLQAAGIVVGLQLSNYVEHWGLDRERHPDLVAWDAADACSVFCITGLARHTDHHLSPGRRFFELHHHAGSPQLPHGYGGLWVRALFANGRLRRRLRAELARRGGLPHEGAAV